ncbi:MAG: ketopantoate reductase family protein [Candidatus Omnitrophica bacterium]|nr:ketopantoate reductase family protein [Candidatus Omnitrophota bacterium]
MKIAVLGCGAIGGLMLGFLTRDGCDVRGVVRDYQKEPLIEKGLIIAGSGKDQIFKVKVDDRLNENIDLACFSTKIDDLEDVIQANKSYLKGALVLTTQNGIGADEILSRHFAKEKIITSIVMFGATFYSPNRVVNNFGNEIIVGNFFGCKVAGLEKAVSQLNKSFAVTIDDEIKGAKYLKVFVNLNNCLAAIIGKSMQETFADLELANLSILLNREAYEVVLKSGIRLNSLPNYPKERLQGLVSMPVEEAAAIFSKIISGLSKEPLYGSILQSIKRGRKSEVDYINGEITRLAKKHNIQAPLNQKITELVHRVENEKRFFSKEELLAEIKGVLSYEVR